jgi:hypothetical protein
MSEPVDIGDVRLAVDQRGHGPAALLVHGTSPAMWGTLPDRLAPS